MNKAFYLFFLPFCLFFSVSVFAQAREPLPVDKAFYLSVKNIYDNTVQLHWEIAPGYHLYRDRFKFQPVDPDHIKLSDPVLPTGNPKHDNILGDYQVYEKHIDITVPFYKTFQNNAIFLVTYQGCSEENFCYPPVTKRITVHFPPFNMHAQVSSHHEAYSSMQDKITDLLQGGNYLWICLGFMGLGLLLAFTPCVLPMIPILSGIIVGQERRNLTTRRAFLLSLSYVIGMSFAYAIAGILVALLGSRLSETFQAPWIIILFSALFVVLALSLFGVYELRLPNFLHHRVLHLSHKQKSGSYVGALIMGLLSVLIVSPCVTAPLVGALTFIAHSGDILLGSTALFSLGLGMGLPLLIIGTTEGRFLPKSGYWMHVVKSAFGVLLLGIAIYLLQRIVPGPVSLMLWAAFFIVLAVYLGVGVLQPRRVSSGWIKFIKGIGLLSFCYGVILLIGGASGNNDVFQPLSHSPVFSSFSAAYNTTQEREGLPFKQVSSLTDLQNNLSQAAKQHKMAMIDFYADWCVSCHEMDRSVFSNPAVRAALKDIVLLRVDVTVNDQNSRMLQDYFKVIAPPTILFFGEDGKELLQFRLVGGVSSEDFLRILHAIFI